MFSQIGGRVHAAWSRPFHWHRHARRWWLPEWASDEKRQARHEVSAYGSCGAGANVPDDRARLLFHHRTAGPGVQGPEVVEVPGERGDPEVPALRRRKLFVLCFILFVIDCD